MTVERGTLSDEPKPYHCALPVKAAQLHRGRRLVYLDQNVISDLAKIKLGRLQPSPRRDALDDFEKSLRAAVHERGDARAVESMLHRWESSAVADEADATNASEDNIDDAEESLFGTIRELLAILSWGLHCKTWFEVVKGQAVLTLVHRRHGVQHPELWRGGFDSDPNESNASAGVEVGGGLFLITANWRPYSILKPGWASIVEADRQRGKYLNRQDARDELRRDLEPVMLYEHDLISWSYLWPNGSTRPTHEQMTAFIMSSSFASCPAMDVKLTALAHILSNRSRPLKDSDQQDVNMLMVAIPYCDLVITDAFMANVVHQEKLDKKYGTVVLSSKAEDLRKAIQWLDEEHTVAA